MKLTTPIPSAMIDLSEIERNIFELTRIKLHHQMQLTQDKREELDSKIKELSTLLVAEKLKEANVIRFKETQQELDVKTEFAWYSLILPLASASTLICYMLNFNNNIFLEKLFSITMGFLLIIYSISGLIKKARND